MFDASRNLTHSTLHKTNSKLYVIVDVSGSMSTMGKTAIVSTSLRTLEQSGITLETIQWNGESTSLKNILDRTNGSKTIMLTDGYAILDGDNSTLKDYVNKNPNQFWLVQCGLDAATNEFSGLKTCDASNLLMIVETMEL